MPKRNGVPVAGLGVDVGVGVDQQSDDSAIAVDRRRQVQRGPAIAAHGQGRGEGVGPHWVPQTQPVPEHKTAGRPRGSTAFSFLVNVNGKSTPSGLGVLAIPLAARASSERAKLQKVVETGLRAKEAARNCEIRQYGRGAYESRNVAS